MSSHDPALDVTAAKSSVVMAISKSIGIVVVVVSLLVTSLATVLILDAQDTQGDRILDCVLPQGQCYETKLRNAQAITNANIVITANYCSNKYPLDLGAAKLCVIRELAK